MTRPHWQWPHRPSKRRLEGVASQEHPLEVEVQRPRWPPFYATSAFLPRLKVRVTNQGERMEKAWIRLDVRDYDGPIDDAPSVTEGWRDTSHQYVNDPWETGVTKRFTLPVRARNLPRAGTYIARIEIARFVRPHESPQEQEERILRQLEGEVPDETIAVVRASFAESHQRLGIDPTKVQSGSLLGEGAGTTTLVELFHVEDYSSVLNFWLVLGTLLVGIGTVLLAVITLIG